MLFIIDIQNDFLDSKRGKMFVNGSEELVDGIIKKIKEYEKRNEKIFYTLNIHEDMEDDNRTKEERKWGQNIYYPLQKHLKAHNYLKKMYYGITPEKASMIKEKYKDKTYSKNIEIIGVETEICVLSNAIILQNMFPDSNIKIDSSLCKSNDLKMHENALDIMKKLKMEVVK